MSARACGCWSLEDAQGGDLVVSVDSVELVEVLRSAEKGESVLLRGVTIEGETRARDLRLRALEVTEPAGRLHVVRDGTETTRPLVPARYFALSDDEGLTLLRLEPDGSISGTHWGGGRRLAAASSA